MSSINNLSSINLSYAESNYVNDELVITPIATVGLDSIADTMQAGVPQNADSVAIFAYPRDSAKASVDIRWTNDNEIWHTAVWSWSGGQENIDESGEEPACVLLSESQTATIEIKVTAENGAQKVYTLDISPANNSLTITGPGGGEPLSDIDIPSMPSNTTYDMDVKDQGGNLLTAGVTWSILEQASLGNSVSIDSQTGLLTIYPDAQPGIITVRVEFSTDSNIYDEVQLQLTTSSISSWQLLGDFGYSGPLLSESDIGLAVNGNGQVFTAYTSSDQEVKLGIYGGSGWTVSEPDPDCLNPGKGPLDLALYDNDPLLAWWDGSIPGDYTVVKQGWNWDIYMAEDLGDINTLSLAVMGDTRLLAYEDDSANVDVMAYTYTGSSWDWVSLLPGETQLSGTDPQVLAGDYCGQQIPYLAVQVSTPGGDILPPAAGVLVLRGIDNDGSWLWLPVMISEGSSSDLSLDTANGNIYLAVKDTDGMSWVYNCKQLITEGYSWLEFFDFQGGEPNWIEQGNGPVVSLFSSMDEWPVPQTAESLALKVADNGTPYLAFKNSDGMPEVMKMAYNGSSYYWLSLACPQMPETATYIDNLQLYVQGDTVYLAYKYRDQYEVEKMAVMSYDDPLAGVDFYFDLENSGYWELSGLQDDMYCSFDLGATEIPFTGETVTGNINNSGDLLAAAEGIMVWTAGHKGEALFIEVPQPDAPCTYTINYEDETTEQPIPHYIEYADDESFVDCLYGSGGAIPLDLGASGLDIIPAAENPSAYLYFRHKGWGKHRPGAVEILTIPARSATPVAWVDASEDIINGLDQNTAYEFDWDGNGAIDFSFNTTTGSSIGILPETHGQSWELDDSFQIRKAAVEYSSFASAWQTVAVAAYSQSLPSPEVNDLGFRYFNVGLEVSNSELPAYDTLEIFIKATDPGETTPGDNEAKYTLDLSIANNRGIGWHDLGSSPGINCNNFMWYRYINGSAKSAWVSDGHPLGFKPVQEDEDHDYGFTAPGIVTVIIKNTNGTLDGMDLLIYRDGEYYLLGEINQLNQEFTVSIPGGNLTTSDKVVIRNSNGNYSYHSDPIIIPE